MFAEVTLAGRPFQIPNTAADKDRRRAFFLEKVKANRGYVDYRPSKGTKAPAGVDSKYLLKDEEYALLDALSIQGDRIIELSNELPLFFEVLPTCSGDTSMMLKRECDVAYYVLWSVLYKMQLQDRDVRRTNMKEKHSVGLTEAAVHASLVDGLDGVLVTPKTDQIDPVAILRLFTRPAHPSIARLPGKLTTEQVQEMFTLRTTMV